MTTDSSTDSIAAKLNAQVESFDTREKWLAARRTYGIGSSDVPAILGISRFQSALSLYHEKKGLRDPSPAYEEHARWGQILEEPIAQRFYHETKRPIYNPNEDGTFKILRRTDKPFMIASVDRIQVADPLNAAAQGFIVDPAMKPAPAPGMGVLEIKNAHLMMRDEWQGEGANNAPPVEYQVQLQHQLAVTGALWGSIAALIGGVIFLWADLPRDQELIDRLIEMETEFMGRLESSNPPAADGSESSREVLRRLYPKDNGELITLGPEALEWHHELQAAKETLKAAKAQEDRYSNLLRQAIGEATGGILSSGDIYTNKWQERAEFVSPRAEFRVLRLKVAGKRGR